MKHVVIVTKGLDSEDPKFHDKLAELTFNGKPSSVELMDLLVKAVKRRKYHHVAITSTPELVTRKNLLTGKEYQEDVDTPSYLSPASETYHSM